MKRIISLLLVANIISGCSFFASPRQNITVMTNVPDAEVFVNGQRAGVGNISYSVKRNKNAQLMVRKDGYYPAYYSVDTQMSTAGVLDIIGGFIWIVPFFGLLAPGSRTLDQDNIALELVQDKGYKAEEQSAK